jgi:hypothetical protein
MRPAFLVCFYFGGLLPRPGPDGRPVWLGPFRGGELLAILFLLYVGWL